MKSQKACSIGYGPIFLTLLLAALQVEVWAEGQEKKWVVFHDQIPENSTRYNVALQYAPSDSIFYSASQRNIKSVALPDSEQIDNYKGRIDFGTVLDGPKYSVLIGDASEILLINRDGRQIRKAQILRSKQDNESEIVKEGYFFLGSQIEIPVEVAGHRLALPATESVPGMLSININSRNPYSYLGSSSTHLKGSLTGSAFIEGAYLEVSVSYKESFRPNDRYVKLVVQPFDKEIAYDSTSGKITDILKLRSAKLVIEKVASDSSEIVLAVIHGQVGQAPEGESYLSVSKPVPAFARVDLIRRELLTLDKLRRKAGSKGYIVLIFGDLKRTPPDYRYRNRATNELTLDETMVLDVLQRGLKTPPVVVFVCRGFPFSDLYERWLGKDPGFYIVADYSNPMDVQFSFPSSYCRPYPRPPTKLETLREQLLLPENTLPLLLVNGKGNLLYIDVDAGQQLAKSLTEINKLMRNKK